MRPRLAGRGCRVWRCARGVVALSCVLAFMDEASSPVAALARAAQRRPKKQTKPKKATRRPQMSDLMQVIEKYWGIKTLRPHQEEAMRAVLANEDCLVLLATGSGKSLCYQAPALLREGLTVVISPHISLMFDQIEALQSLGVPAAGLNSHTSNKEFRNIHDILRRGELRLLYMSPERFAKPGQFAELTNYNLESIVVDEAHCICKWGISQVSFREEYAMIGAIRGQSVPVIAVTATATREEQDCIIKSLGMQHPRRIVGEFDRPSLNYSVQLRSKPKGLLPGWPEVEAVVDRHLGQAGLIYVLSRAGVDQMYMQLRRKGVKCARYHAGMDEEERNNVSKAFKQKSIDIVVATVAFGLGIDRSDVRFVLHCHMPKSLSQYVQETGRAGRDGLPAECVLLWDADLDWSKWRQFGDVGEQDWANWGAMVSFTVSHKCRHMLLAEHFGHELHTPCGEFCDVCCNRNRNHEEKAPDDVARAILRKLEDMRPVAQQPSALVDMLNSDDALKKRSKLEWRWLFEQLVEQGLLDRKDHGFSTLLVSQVGMQLLKNKGQIAELWLPQGATAATTALAQPASKTSRASKVAKELAMQELELLADKFGQEFSLPRGLVLKKQVRDAIAKELPQNEKELLSIKGMGPKTMAKIGGPILDVVKRATMKARRIHEIAKVS